MTRSRHSDQQLKLENVPDFPQVSLRPPSRIMRLDRMGSFFPTRLSFLRSLLRDLASQGSRVERTHWKLDDDGYGHAAYSVKLQNRTYTLVCYSSALDDASRTDRVIAEAWDACFVLFDGEPDRDDILALHSQVIRQEAGRYNDRVLVLSRANKSVRLFDHVVGKLAAGKQPDSGPVEQIGYLMRTTAVYGNGKFGLAGRAQVMRHPGLGHPFRLEMLTVWLIREFTYDLVDHVAKMRGGEHATVLSQQFRHQLGIGNSTGLGMAPFLVSHPTLINNWMLVRETALARVRALEQADADIRQKLIRLREKVSTHLCEWNVTDANEQKRIEALRKDWATYSGKITTLLELPRPFDLMVQESESGSSDLQELVVSLVLEPHGWLIDGLTECMEANEEFVMDPSMTVGALLEILNDQYEWCARVDVGNANSAAMVWYISEEKLEPRLGERRVGENDNCEMPHAISQFVGALRDDLADWRLESSIAEFLAQHPQHRHMVRRTQLMSQHPYGEIRDNLLASDMRPIDLLRCKLSFFGASRFDPRSDRWTRITLFQGAPCANELTQKSADDCFLPSFAASV